MAAIDSGKPEIRKLGESHGFDGCFGIDFNMSAIDPPLNRGA